MYKVRCRTCQLHILERIQEVGSLGGAEHKPGTNGNVGSVVKQYAEITGHDIHPNYASILEIRVKNKEKRLFLGSFYSFLDKNSVYERASFPSVMMLHYPMTACGIVCALNHKFHLV